jgi:hypothetical protein
MRIAMHRGDKRNFKVSIYDGDSEDLIDFDLSDIYVTFKKNFTDYKYLFQKRLSDGTVTVDPEHKGTYLFSIIPDDTNALSFGDYVFDIELVRYDGGEIEIKQTYTGTFILMEEATHARNEV